MAAASVAYGALQVHGAITFDPESLDANGNLFIKAGVPYSLLLNFYHKPGDTDPNKKASVNVGLMSGAGVLTAKVKWLPGQGPLEGQYQIRYSVDISGDYIMGIHELNVKNSVIGVQCQGSPVTFSAIAATSKKQKASKQKAAVDASPPRKKK